METFDSSKFEFKNSEVLLKIFEDPTDKKTQLDDLLEGEVINKGKDCIIYKVGDKILVRNDVARPLKSPFKKDERIVYKETNILCKYPK